MEWIAKYLASALLAIMLGMPACPKAAAKIPPALAASIDVNGDVVAPFLICTFSDTASGWRLMEVDDLALELDVSRQTIRRDARRTRPAAEVHGSAIRT